MTKNSRLPLVAGLLLCLLPQAALLATIAITGALSLGLASALAGVSVLGAWMLAATAFQALGRRSANLEAIARSMENRTPAHLLPDSKSPFEAVERELLEAAGSLLDEVEILVEQRDEFEAILGSMTEAVVVTGRRGEVVLLNKEARELFALSPEADYAGRDFVELCRDPRLQEFVARSTAATGGERRMANVELAIQNPASRFLRVNAAPIRASRKGTAAWVLVFVDVTRLKAYESLRSDFIANLTHELRTPLSAICGYAETLLRGVDDSATECKFLEIIDRQAKRLARLLDDLISLSDLERGLTPFTFEPVRPRRLIEEAIELMTERARQRGLRLEVNCAEDLPVLHGDRDRLHQVLLNLLDNALKYTPRGGRVTVSARTLSASDNGRTTVEFAVADTGEGIPAVHIPRLTERFYRVDRARSRELGGTGLGLAIVKHIVQLHQGRLSIASQVREGTTVTVRLPLVQTVQ